MTSPSEGAPLLVLELLLGQDALAPELSEPAETAAGVIAIAGSALVLIGAAVGFPVRR